MRIMFLYMFPLWGNGSGAWLRALAAEMVKDGNEVAIVAPETRTLPGVIMERKSLSLALHFRAAPDQESAVRGVAGDAIKGAVPPLRLMDGKAVVEIIPAGIEKGQAIERFMQIRPYAGRRPVFAGDDVTDESGFSAVNRAYGLSIHVGHNPVTMAQFRFPDPASLRNWLEGLNAALGGDPVHEYP